MKITKWLNSLVLICLLFAAPALAQHQSANTGAEVDSAIDQVQAATTSSAGATDSGKLAELDGSGLLDTSFIPDLSGTYVTSETDPIVGAINGIVEADGAGNISAASSIDNITITLGDDAGTTEGRLGFDATNDIFEVYDGAAALNVGTLKGPATGDTYTNFGEAADDTVDSLFGAIDDSWPAGTGAPTDAPYITSAANATLSNETVLSDEASLYGLLSDVTDFVQTGELDYYTDSDIDAHLSGGTGITYSAGVISITNTPLYPSDFTTDGGFLVGTGAGTYTEESGATARTSLGLGAAAVLGTAAVTDAETDVPTGNDVYDFCETTQAYIAADSTDTLTNKTLDANGTGNNLSNIDEDNMLDNSDIVRDGIEFVIDGGGSAITTGQKGHIEVPYACTIQRVTTLADQSGSIVVDVWVDTYANFPPADADSITASAPPTLSTAQAAQDSTLTGWTTALSAGDIIAYNVDSATTVERVTVSLVVEK